MFGTGLGIYIPIALYVGFWICMLASILWNPRLGLYLAILVAPLQTVRARLADYPFGANILTLLVASVFVGCLFRRYFPARSGMNAVLVLLIGYLYFSVWVGVGVLPNSIPVWFSDDRLSQWKDYVIMLMMFFCASMAIRERKHAGVIVAMVVLSILLVYRSSVLELLIRDYSQYSEDKRPAGPLGYAGANGLAAFLSQYTLLLTAFLVAKVSRIKKAFLIAIIGVGGFAILFSYSRGAYISFVAALFVLAAVRYRKLIPVLLLLLACWQVVLPLSVRERITGTYNKNAGFESSAASRLQLWDFAIEKFQANPILGLGHATFQFIDNGTNLRDTHNWYVKVLFENGIVGMLIYCLLIYQMFRTAIRLYLAEQSNWRYLGLGLLLCLVSLVISNFFGDRWTYVEVNGLLWVCLGIAAKLVAEKESQPSDHELAPEESQVEAATA